MRSRLSRPLVYAACAVAAAIPPITVLLLLARFATPAPFWDQWTFVPLLLDAWHGHLRWDLLWSQANEHRLVLPRLIWLALALPSRWDIRLEFAASVAIAFATVWVLARLAQRTLATVGWWAPPLVTALASAFVFSTACYENWLWGWQVQIFLTVWFAVWIAAQLARWDGTDRGLATLVVATVLAPFSFASGLVLLPLLPLAVAVGSVRAGRWRRVAIAAACSIATAGLYLHGLEHPGQHPSPWLIVQRPWEFTQYGLAYVGAPMGRLDADASVTWGGVGVAIVLLAGGRCWWRVPALRPALLAWLFLTAYVAGNGAMTGVGRMGFGVAQALSSRYLTISGVFWVALPALVLLAWTTVPDGTRRAFAAGVLCASLPWLVRGHLDTIAASRVPAREYANHFQTSEVCLLQLDRVPEQCLWRIAPQGYATRVLATQLRTAGLGPYAHAVPEPPLESYRQQFHPTPAGSLDSARIAPKKFVVQLAGWAMDPVHRRHALGVLIAVDGAAMGRARVERSRPDIVATFGSQVGRAGWRYDLITAPLAAGPHTVSAYAIFGDGNAIQAIGERTIQIP